MVQDIPLARALHASCELGQEVPAQLFTAVARVLAFVMHLSARGVRGGMHRPGFQAPAADGPAQGGPAPRPPPHAATLPDRDGNVGASADGRAGRAADTDRFGCQDWRHTRRRAPAGASPAQERGPWAS